MYTKIQKMKNQQDSFGSKNMITLKRQLMNFEL